jgi:CRP-like cAMP-binding protein
VFAQGDRSDAVFFIQKGKVKVSVLSAQGKEAVIAFLGAGDFIGEACLRGQALRISTATALAESEIARIDKATMLSTLREEPKFSELFTSYLLGRTLRVEEDLVDQLFNSSEKRLARAPDPGECGEGRSAGSHCSERRPGDAGGDDRHHALARQPLHEQVPATGPHRVQRQYQSTHVAPRCGLARKAAANKSAARAILNSENWSQVSSFDQTAVAPSH